MMRNAILTALVIMLAFPLSMCGDNNAGGGQIQCNTSGGEYSGPPPSGCPTPQPTAAPVNPTHIFNMAYIGQYNGSASTVTAAAICAAINMLEDGQVGNGAGRPISIADNVNCFAIKYGDIYRPDGSSPSSPGGWLVSDAANNGFSECSPATFLHTPVSLGGPGCAPGNTGNFGPTPPPNYGVAGRTIPAFNVNNIPTTSLIWNINFANLTTAALWRACLRGDVSTEFPLLVNEHNSCDGQSPNNGVDPHPGLTSDAGFAQYSDTSTSTQQADTQCCSKSVEILNPGSNDATFQADVKAYFAAAYQHVNGTPFDIWDNGGNRGVGNFASPTKGQASCIYASNGNCVTLAQITGASHVNLEFFMENQGVAGHIDKLLFWPEFGPGYLNSASDLLANGIGVEEETEYESATYDQHCTVIGTNPNTMTAYYAATMLQYNPRNPHAIAEKLDVDSHVLLSTASGGTCSTGNPATDESPQRAAGWPIQKILASSFVNSLAIPVTAYNSGNGRINPAPTYCAPKSGTQGTTCYGIDGCANGTDPSGETDSGGIIPYLIPGSCALADDAKTEIGTYANATNIGIINGLTITAGTGALMWAVNMSATAFTIPCSYITTLGNDLGVTWNSTTFQHEIDVGQGGGSGVAAVFGDVFPTDSNALPGGGGGTLSVYNNVTNGGPLVACGSTMTVPADAGRFYSR